MKNYSDFWGLVVWIRCLFFGCFDGWVALIVWVDLWGLWQEGWVRRCWFDCLFACVFVSLFMFFLLGLLWKDVIVKGRIKEILHVRLVVIMLCPCQENHKILYFLFSFTLLCFLKKICFECLFSSSFQNYWFLSYDSLS